MLGKGSDVSDKEKKSTPTPKYVVVLLAGWVRKRSLSNYK
jgi:hypothetical protein